MKNKNLRLIFLCLICWFWIIYLSSCKNQTPFYSTPVDCAQSIDSVVRLKDSAVNLSANAIRTLFAYVDSLNTERGAVTRLRDSLEKQKRTIRYEDYRNARIVAKIQYYWDISESRPANVKYFRGWTGRALRMAVDTSGWTLDSFYYVLPKVKK